MSQIIAVTWRFNIFTVEPSTADTVQHSIMVNITWQRFDHTTKTIHSWMTSAIVASAQISGQEVLSSCVWLNHSFHEQWEGSVFKLKFAISCWFHIFYYQQCQEVFSSHCYFQMTGIYTSTRKSTTLVRILTFVLTLLIPMRRRVVARLSVLSVPLASHTTTSSTTWQVQTRLHWCTADCCITACVIHYCVCVCVYICCWSERAVKSSEVC